MYVILCCALHNVSIVSDHEIHCMAMDLLVCHVRIKHEVTNIALTAL